MPHKKKNILLTTPDYPPMLGGLSTFTVNLEKIIKTMGHKVQILNWKNIKEIKNYSIPKEIDLIMNVHFFPCHYLKDEQKREQINFVHGSEILFTSPSLVKKIIKNILKKRMLKSIKKSKYNIFISNFTMNKLNSKGFEIDYARDIIFHNTTNMENSFLHKNIIKNDLKFVSIARDVPHKNLRGSVNLLERIKSVFPEKEITLYITANLSSQKIQIINISGESNEKLKKYYSESHFNLLLSKDHSHHGFFEGFGLTCLEAASFGTPSIVRSSGGLPENVHHLRNGIVINDENTDISDIERLIRNDEEYIRMRIFCYEHTFNSHSNQIYERPLRCLLGL